MPTDMKDATTLSSTQSKTTTQEVLATEKKLMQLDRAFVEEITANVAWIMPGATCVRVDGGRFMIHIPMPEGWEYRFFTPEKGSDKWTVIIRNIAEGERLILGHGDQHKLAGTPEEIAVRIVFNWCRDFIGDSGHYDRLYELSPAEWRERKKCDTEWWAKWNAERQMAEEKKLKAA